MGRSFNIPPQAFVVVGLLAAVGLIALTLLPRTAPAAAQAQSASEPLQANPKAEPEPALPRLSTSAAPPARARPAATSFAVARPAGGQELVVRSRPGGKVLARLGAKTEFGSPQTVGVVRTRGRWLGVVTTYLSNGRLGWIDPQESPLRLARTKMSLLLDLSGRRLVLKRGDHVLRRMTVGVGRPGSSTPTGRFAVTDKLSGAAYGPYYGCCIVALSAHQPNLPAGWKGGDRIAIHGTNDPGSIGVASSAGCPHARDSDLRVLMRRVPFGTPVFVRR
jgi:lipoprotein-anchoring transpeptidase ErfK/SrfK